MLRRRRQVRRSVIAVGREDVAPERTKTMIRTTGVALGMLGLLAGAAFAAPAPNDVGVTQMGGGVYYNPYLQTHQAPPAGNQHSETTNQHSEIGVTSEGGGVYRG